MQNRTFLKLMALLSLSAVGVAPLAGCKSYEKLEADNSDGTYSLSEKNVRLLGRYYQDEKDGFTYFSWSNAGFEIRFYGTGVEAYLNTNIPEKELEKDENKNSIPMLSIYVDGKEDPEEVYKVFRLDRKEGWYTLADGLKKGYHTITVRKRERGYYGILQGVSFGAKQLKITDGQLAEVPEAKALKIEAIGDSITCGDGIYETSQYDGMQVDSWSTYAAETARLLDADLNTIAISGNGLISSLFGDHLLDLPGQWPYIDTQIYSRRDWDFSKYQSDIVVINLGTNDRAGVGPGKKFTYEEFENEYVRFVEEIKEQYPDCKVIACLGAMGSELQPQIENAIERVNENAGAGNEYMYSVWFEPNVEQDGYSADKNHPSLAAHRRYGRQLAEKISELTGAKINKNVK